MRLSGVLSAAKVSGLAGLSGTNAGAVYGQYAGKVKQVFETPFPSPTGTRPPDALIFTDKFAYLRQVLNNADWDGVARWYATIIQQAVNASGYLDPLTYAPVESRPVSVEPVPQVYIDTLEIPIVQTVPEAPPVIAAPPPPVATPAPAPVRTGGGVSSGGRGNVRLNGLAGLSGLNPREYWNLSKLNLQDYCDRTLNLQDLNAHTQKCILQMCIADYGNKVGFGYAGAKDYLNLALFFANGLSHNDGQLDWLKSYESAKNGSRYGFCLGWVKEPSKHTASRIIVAIGAAFMGAAAWQAISAGAGAASGGATGAAGGTGAGAGAGAATGAAATTGIETVVVTASVAAPVTAGTVAAGLAAGTIAASAAAPAIAAPSTTLETVVVEAAPVSAVTAGSVAAGVATGAVTAVAAAPPIVAPSTPPPQVIETVTTEASAIPQTPVTAGTVGAGVTAGAIVATTAPPITSGTIETVTVEAPADTIQLDPVEAAAIGTGVIAITQPVIDVPEPNLPEIEDGEPTLTDRIVEELENAIADYGAEWVRNQLEQLLQDLLGRPPTQTEIDDWEDWINGGGTTPPPQMSGSTPNWIYWLLGAAIAYALYEYSREPKKRRRKSH